MSEGLISAVELDYEKNEVLGLTEQDNFRLLMKKWLGIVICLLWA